MSAGLIQFLSKDASNVVVFESSGTYNKPANLHKALVIVTGNGGAGREGTSGSPDRSGAGGGAGATVIDMIDADTILSSETVTIGSPSSFGAHITANGGSQPPVSTLGLYGGLGGDASGGLINVNGGHGSSNAGQGGTEDASGKGGNSFWGDGGPARRSNTISADGRAYGSGGGGGTVNAANQGSGATGVVVIIEYLIQ